MLSCLESFCAAEVPQRHGSSLEIYMALFLPTCMDRMYSEFFSSTIFHRKKVTSDFFAEEVVEDLARVVYDPILNWVDFGKPEDLVHPLMISLKVLQRDVLFPR